MINKSEYSDGKQDKRKMKLFTYLPKLTFRAEERGVAESRAEDREAPICMMAAASFQDHRNLSPGEESKFYRIPRRKRSRMAGAFDFVKGPAL